MFLDCVVCKMDKFVEGVQREVWAGSPYIALSVVVPLDIGVNRSHKSIATNVEFPVLDQKGLCDVSLDYIGVIVGVLNNWFYFGKVWSHFDSSSLVCVFSWFYYPNLSSVSFAEFLELVVTLVVSYVKCQRDYIK